MDNDGNKYEMKGFTRNGCKFVPSSMLGKGRHIDINLLAEGIRDHKLTYIIIDISEFPFIRVKFIDGNKLLKEYPTGEIRVNKKEDFFIE